VSGTFGLPPDPLASAGFGAASNPLAGSPFGVGGEVSSFFIENFRVPPFLLPLYWEAQARYGVPWEVLAGINEVETDYGLDLSLSSAGAEGWMQFLPGTWSEYGVDATGAGMRDPYNPADAIFAAARYLVAAGATSNLRGAIFAYNHSEIYVESVLLRARLLAGTPPAMLNALAAIARSPAPAGGRARASTVGHVHGAMARLSVATDGHPRDGHPHVSGSTRLSAARAHASSAAHVAGVHVASATRNRPPAPAAVAADAASAGLPAAQLHALLAHLASLPQPRVPLAATSASVPDRAGGVDLPPPGRLTPAQLQADLANAAADLGSLSEPNASALGASPQLPGPGGLSFQPVIGLPSHEIELIGPSPEEAPGEVWAQAHIGAVPVSANGQQIANATVLLRHAGEGSSSWQVVPVANAQGEQLKFTPIIDRASPEGGIVLLGAGGSGQQSVVVRDPGGAFAEATPPSASGPGALLEHGQQLYPPESAKAMVAAIVEAGRTSALVVPAGGAEPDVLRYDGAQWTREQLCTQLNAGHCTAPGALTALALAAASPQSAWLLASSGTEPLMLFQRAENNSGTPVWVQRHPSSWVFGAGSPPTGVTVNARTQGSGPVLTPTSQGVWVDARLSLGAQGGDLTAYVPNGEGAVGGPWCYLPESAPAGVCAGSLGAPLPGKAYESAAWSGGEDGTRVIAGLPHGALLRFSAGGFSYLPGGGGVGASSAAFVSPEEGWLEGASGASGSLAYHMGAQLLHVTAAPAANQLRSWPVPFRRPLTAIVGEPGTAPGEANAQALAVGAEGQIARYLPGQGWTPEFLYSATTGERMRPSLRGVAWPEAGRAYAVGSGGEMWLWRSDTGLWEPDPAKPLDFHGNLNAIAFDPSDPSIGFAVGKQGALLAYGKTWTQQALAKLPEGLRQANFTSVAFAGKEAVVGYRALNSAGQETGGLLVDREPENGAGPDDEVGSGWQIETEAQQLLEQLSEPKDTVISKVAGLPDGGTVAAGPGIVIERDPGSPSWHFSAQPLPEATSIAALAAFQEGGSVRALVSIDTSLNSLPNGTFVLGIDNPPASAIGAPPLYLEPDPLPVTGYLLRETAAGWQDTENEAFPEPELAPAETQASAETEVDLPDWPDPVLALLTNPAGSEGWAVGGQTGARLELSTLTGAGAAVQTSAVFRIGGGPAPAQGNDSPIPTPAGEATFAVGGNAQCADPCADYGSVGIGPDAWLSGALQRAAQISGLHSFLYSGARIGQNDGLPFSTDAFQREMSDYANVLRGAGSLPVYAAASPSDVDPSGGLGTFAGTLGPAAPAGSAPAGTPPPPSGAGAYAFDSPGAGGTVRVIVLDYSQPTLGAAQTAWLAAQLQAAAGAREPAIVLGNGDPVDAQVPNYARDAAGLTAVLVQGHASAYFYDSPGENRSDTLGSGAGAVPAYGSGTLGYVLPPSPQSEEEFLGAGGFLLASVDVAARNAANRAPVSVTLTPNIAQLAINATAGTLLRRSQVALFEGLARRPAGGEQLSSGVDEEEAPDPYVPVPEICKGARCGHFIAPAYTFSSSRPDIGNFVERDPNQENPRAVLQGSDGKPIPDAASGLFCAFNAGTTTVTITTGGLSYSEQVTVQPGSVEQPCGTVPLVNPPAATAKTAVSLPAPPPSPAPAAASPTPLSPVLPPPPSLPAPPAPAPAPHVAVHQPVPPPFFVLPQLPVALVAVPLLPPPTVARPIPPSGTAPIFGQALAPKEEQEDEEAVESARANMALYVPEDPTLPPATLLGLLVVAAGAGVGIRRAGRSRRSRRTPVLARAVTRDRLVTNRRTTG
jgi:Transglycosylase SLT domain